ncbi:polysaccharide biosynthesis protein [Xenorhabdus santafensis]|uniref:polysaccharide biosynthesis protein n=1 Tax=Xenorhabdus santafensis TaxID=2582833 RepID=UPI0029E805BF|nr:polysaccharide biosynthesis protein [Xenorhabdus sp. 12]
MIFLNLIIPAIVIRFYSAYDFGIYSYFLAYAIVVSILQNGMTASFRNVISNLPEKEILYYLLFTVKKISRPIILTMILVGGATILIVGYNSIYAKIIIFILSSLVNLFYPLVSSYFDTKGSTVKFVLYEILFSILSLLVVYILSFLGLGIFLICIITVNYRGVYAISILIYNAVKLYKTREKSVNCGNYIIFGFNDILFSAIQIVNVLNSLLFMNMLARHYGIIAFGIFSLYYRFVSFPQQIVGFSSSLIWIKFRQVYFSNIETSRSFIKKLFSSFIISLMLWAILVHFSMDKVIQIYSSKDLVYPGHLALLNVMICLILFKDFSSIILNALNIYKIQLILNFILLLLNFYFWNLVDTTSFDSLYIIAISALNFICVIMNLYLIKKKVFNKC